MIFKEPVEAKVIMYSGNSIIIANAMDDRLKKCIKDGTVATSKIGEFTVISSTVKTAYRDNYVVEAKILITKMED